MCFIKKSWGEKSRGTVPLSNLSVIVYFPQINSQFLLTCKLNVALFSVFGHATVRQQDDDPWPPVPSTWPARRTRSSGQSSSRLLQFVFLLLASCSSFLVLPIHVPSSPLPPIHSPVPPSHVPSALSPVPRTHVPSNYVPAIPLTPPLSYSILRSLNPLP